jgi:hypothetical protein
MNHTGKGCAAGRVKVRAQEEGAAAGDTSLRSVELENPSRRLS